MHVSITKTGTHRRRFLVALSALVASCGGGSDSANGAPKWDPAPALEFVEGVPSQVRIADFVRDPDGDPLRIAMASGTLLPGFTWNPTTGVLAYDGRPLGAKPTAPVIAPPVTFTADDGH